MRKIRKVSGGVILAIMSLIFLSHALAGGASPGSARRTAWRKILLEESARLKVAIKNRANLPAEYFIAFPEQSATEGQLEENLINLLVVSYDLTIVKPITGVKIPRRLSEGISSGDAGEAVEDIKASQKHIEEQLAGTHIELKRKWNPDLALDEIKLKASRIFWDNELKHLIESLRIN